jgi:hypothetical protein
MERSNYFSINEVRAVVVNPLVVKSTFLSPNKSNEERYFMNITPTDYQDGILSFGGLIICNTMPSYLPEIIIFIPPLKKGFVA